MKNIKDIFNNKYKNNPNSFGQEPIEILKKILKFIKEGDALLLGVGNGRNASFLLEQGFRVTGIDISEIGLDVLKDKYQNNKNLDLILGDVLKIDFDKQYELITAIGLLHFFEKEDGQKIIAKMKDSTKKGGFNVLAVRMVQNPMNTLPYIFSNGELKRYYENDNWEIKEYTEVNSGEKKVAMLIAQKK